MRVTRHDHLTLLDAIIPMIFGGEQKIMKLFIKRLFQPRVIYTLLGPNILFNILFLNTPNLRLLIMLYNVFISFDAIKIKPW